jgi:hypothetical protein
MTNNNFTNEINEILSRGDDDIKKWLNDKGFYQYYNLEHWVTSKIKYNAFGLPFNHKSQDYTNYGFTQKEAVAYQILIIDNNQPLEEFTSKKWN